MLRPLRFTTIVAILGMAAACGPEPSKPIDVRDAPKLAEAEPPTPREPYTLAKQIVGTFDNPWAIAFEPGTSRLFVTEKAGAIKLRTENGAIHNVAGGPAVDYGGEGGLAEIAFAPDYAVTGHLYLTWVEPGRSRTRGAVVGRGKLDCEDPTTCRIYDLTIIWRQLPKVRGRGHYSHRIAFAPDGQTMYVTSGDRHDWQSAQSSEGTLGKIVRLTLDGKPAPGNAGTGNAPPADEFWSIGHRNPMGIAFDAAGQLWIAEHGPVGGDELNLIETGGNYGWPHVSEGRHTYGVDITRHSERPEFIPPVLSWDPVIAPGGMIVHSGAMFSAWKGQALITGLRSRALIRVELGPNTARELERYPMEGRMRAIAEGPDGAIWVAEEGPGAKLLRITPKS